MRVGSSPVYFILGQESLLERFSQYLKSKEKEAFLLLKEEKFLIDIKQNPAIRVALREIKDFAIPFKRDEEIIWRYLSIPETEFKIKEKQKPIIKKQPAKEEELDIFDKEKPKKKKTIKKKASQKNEKFFMRVKEFLTERSIELKDIEGFDKNWLVLRIETHGEEKLLVAYNKKRINENDIIKANKKAKESNLPYMVLSLGEPLKKMSVLIDAIKNLISIEKLK